MMCKIIKEKYMPLKTMVLLSLFSLLLFKGSAASKGGLQGLYLCFQVLIPSLFPFIVLTNLTVNSGVSAYLGKYLKYFTKLIFGVSGNCGATILLSFIGGYPIGARGISNLYKNKIISESEAKKLSYSLMCGGPGFVLIFLGETLLNTIEIGWCIFASQILSVIILGIINKHIFPTKEIQCSYKKADYPFGEALINSIGDSTYAIIEMCGIVILFSSFISVLENLLISLPNLYPYLVSVLEVTTSANILSKSNNIFLLAFSIGFGGLSVHLQIFQAIKEIPINKWVFMLFKIIQGLLTCGFTFAFIKLFNISIPVYSSIENVNFSLSTSIIGSALLLFTGICFLYNLKNYKN